MVATKVSRSRTFEKQIAKVPQHIREKAMAWIVAVELKGIASIRKNPGYHDEPLHGLRHGQRSVWMNKAYRIIYETIEDNVYILLMEINKHGY